MRTQRRRIMSYVLIVNIVHISQLPNVVVLSARSCANTHTCVLPASLLFYAFIVHHSRYIGELVQRSSKVTAPFPIDDRTALPVSSKESRTEPARLDPFNLPISFLSQVTCASLCLCKNPELAPTHPKAGLMSAFCSSPPRNVEEGG